MLHTQVMRWEPSSSSVRRKQRVSCDTSWAWNSAVSSLDVARRRRLSACSCSTLLRLQSGRHALLLSGCTALLENNIGEEREREREQLHCAVTYLRRQEQRGYRRALAACAHCRQSSCRASPPGKPAHTPTVQLDTRISKRKAQCTKATTVATLPRAPAAPWPGP